MTDTFATDAGLLRNSQILRDASPHLVKVFGDVSQMQNLKKGTYLFEQGDLDDSLYVVSEGALEVSVVSAEGRKLSLNVLHAGDVFGEIALLDPGPRTASICATTPSQLLRVTRSRLFEALKSEPELAIEMLGLAGKRLRWMSNRHEEFVFLPLEARLALKVLHFLETSGGENGTILMSQADLADHVGATREAVSKILSTWKRSGMVELKRGAVCVLNQDHLEEIAIPEFF